MIVLISDFFLEQLKNACRIEEIINSYVELKPSGGGRFVGLCPFHAEKTPSMMVYTNTQSFYCFGCGAGGDVISFIMKIENLEYIDALKFLSQRAKIDFIEDENNLGQQNIKKRLLAANIVAAKFFYKNLLNSVEVKRYLMRERKLKVETIKKFGLGFAPADYFNLTQHMLNLGFSVDELLEAKLVTRGNGKKIYDVFRNRIMIPIINTKSEIIGFGGRALGDFKPKYLNSKDSLLFKKTNNLFNLNLAKAEKTDTIILVEGYFDAIAIVQAGVNNVVATLGTALTTKQAQIISMYAKRVVLSYDSDQAGINATRRAVNILSELGLQVDILNLGAYKDPDEFIKKNGSVRFKNAVNSSVAALDFEFNAIKNKFDLQNTQDKSQFLKEVAAWLSKINNQLDREVFISKISTEQNIDHQVLSSYVNNLIKRRIKSKEKAVQNKAIKQLISKTFKSANNKGIPQKYVISEELIICTLYKNPDFFQFLNQVCPSDLFITENATIYNVLLKRLQESQPIEITCLNSELDQNSIEKLSGILARNNDIMLNKDIVLECVNNLKRYRQESMELKASQMSGEELKQYLEEIYKSKNI
ncbi:MAG: DNA primase [Oscillospiraceae bacterium]|nr:DNA primase [Oscillospiraceae bacterium]